LAERLRATVPLVAEVVVDLPDIRLRARPRPGEWSAIEVVGHLIDKFDHWAVRARRAVSEEFPHLDPYDQDRCVRDSGYQDADLTLLLGRLAASAERFARFVETLDATAMERPADHGEYGRISAHDCVVLPLQSMPEHLAQARAAASG